MNELIAKLYDQALVLESNGDYVAGELDIEKFAELIAAKEREACIEIAEKQRYGWHITLPSNRPQNGTAVGIANQIRARGEVEDKNT